MIFALLERAQLDRVNGQEVFSSEMYNTLRPALHYRDALDALLQATAELISQCFLDFPLSHHLHYAVSLSRSQIAFWIGCSPTSAGFGIQPVKC